MLLYVYGNHYFSFSEPRCVSNYFISVVVHFFSDSRKLYTKKKFGKLLIVIIILSFTLFRNERYCTLLNFIFLGTT